MKKLLFVITLFFFGKQLFCQKIVPELNQYYKTSSHYLGCKDADKIEKLMKAVRNMDEPKFIEYQNNGDCFQLSVDDLRAKLVFISNDGNFVKLKREGVKAYIWTVTEALRDENSSSY